MRLVPFALILAFPAMADSPVGVMQHDAPITLEREGEAYVAQLAPGRFVLTVADDAPDVIGVTFGTEGLFAMLDLPPETGLFGPATSYAREEGPEAPHFMADPLCANEFYGPGFNILDIERATPEGFPIASLQVDAASRRCDEPTRLPSDTDLMGVVNPLHAVIRTEAGDTLLILRFVGS